jgi:hypothetical protein
LANETKKVRRKASTKRKKVATAAAEAKEIAPVPKGKEALTGAKESEHADPKAGKQRRKSARKDK